jgi:hypothetical protein
LHCGERSFTDLVLKGYDPSEAAVVLTDLFGRDSKTGSRKTPERRQGARLLI